MTPKRLARPLMRLAFWGLHGWSRLTGRPLRGAAVALWHDGQLLVVRHSYHPGYCLPGGLLRRGEDPRQAACRELREELGIALPPQDLLLLTDRPVGRHHDHIFEYRPPERPRLRIDNWEIIEARFVEPAKLGQGNYRLAGNLRRAHQILREVPSRPPAKAP